MTASTSNIIISVAILPVIDFSCEFIISVAILPVIDFSCEFIVFFDMKVGTINKTIGNIKIVALLPQLLGINVIPH